MLPQADLAALWHGLDALLQWQAEVAAKAAAGGYAVEVPAVQTAFLLDIGVKANLQNVTQVLLRVALMQNSQERHISYIQDTCIVINSHGCLSSYEVYLQHDVYTLFYLQSLRCMGVYQNAMSCPPHVFVGLGGRHAGAGCSGVYSRPGDGARIWRERSRRLRRGVLHVCPGHRCP